MWAILLLNRFYFNKKNNYYRCFNNKILLDVYFYKLKIYNISLILSYVLFGFKYLDFKLFYIHLIIFFLSTIKLATSDNSKNGNGTD